MNASSLVVEWSWLHGERNASSSSSDEEVSEILRKIASDAGYLEGEISVAIVDDQTMHQLNSRHLQHDYTTDILSFLLGDGERLEGELIACWDVARRVAEQGGWNVHWELLLYLIHGMLHLVGYDDHDPIGLEKMKRAECIYLQLAGCPISHLEGLERFPREHDSAVPGNESQEPHR
jgi:probable rRNA maturation factor